MFFLKKNACCFVVYGNIRTFAVEIQDKDADYILYNAIERRKRNFVKCLCLLSVSYKKPLSLSF
jgi:hypothetical protein